MLFPINDKTTIAFIYLFAINYHSIPKIFLKNFIDLLAHANTIDVQIA